MVELNRSITNVKNFADRLRYARTLRGLSQAALAHACGLSQGAIANYESNARQSAKEIFRIAEVLNVNPVWLGMGSGPMEPLEPPLETQATYRLSEAEAPRVPGLWPFGLVSADDYWALPQTDRAIVERMFATLVKSLQNKSQV